MAKEGWSKSSFLDVIRGILGPKIRVWTKGELVEVGYDMKGKRLILASGKGYQDAIQNLFVKPMERRERMRKVMQEELEAGIKKNEETVAAMKAAADGADSHEPSAPAPPSLSDDRPE